MFELADRLVGIYKTHDVTKSVTINPKQFAQQQQQKHQQQQRQNTLKNEPEDASKVMQMIVVVVVANVDSCVVGGVGRDGGLDDGAGAGANGYANCDDGGAGVNGDAINN